MGIVAVADPQENAIEVLSALGDAAVAVIAPGRATVRIGDSHEPAPVIDAGVIGVAGLETSLEKVCVPFMPYARSI